MATRCVCVPAVLPVAVKVDRVSEGETAYVTIAAVDQGILNLTGFAAPDPQGHYFGQRKLGVGIRDIYGRLIDGMNGAEGTVRSGGDAGAQARLQAPPPTEELVAYFTGPIEVGADGYARAEFTLPAFNGTVKVMAVAWSKSGVGQGAADVLVRDPVVVTASLPRFMASLTKQSVRSPVSRSKYFMIPPRSCEKLKSSAASHAARFSASLRAMVRRPGARAACVRALLALSAARSTPPPGR